MPRLLLALTLFFAVSLPAHALWLLSDPWPEGGRQPDACTAFEPATSSSRDLSLEATQTGRKFIRENMDDAVVGSHYWDIVCSDALGSSTPAPFDFVIDAPVTPLAPPAGLRLAP